MLILFLVIFPLISWMYLRFGMDYRIEALEKLEDHGRVGDYYLPAETGDSLRFSEIKGKVVVASFFGFRSDSLVAVYGDRLQRLHGQFGGRPEVLFLQHVLESGDAMQKAHDFRTTYNLADTSKVKFVFPGPEKAEELMDGQYHLPGYDRQDPAGNPFIALLDTAHVIRRYYDVREEASMRELVEHLAIVIPPVKDRDLVFKREKEK